MATNTICPAIRLRKLTYLMADIKTIRQALPSHYCDAKIKHTVLLKNLSRDSIACVHYIKPCLFNNIVSNKIVKFSDNKQHFNAITGSYSKWKSHDKTFFLQVLICGCLLYHSSKVNRIAIKLNNRATDGKKQLCLSC